MSDNPLIKVEHVQQWYRHSKNVWEMLSIKPRNWVKAVDDVSFELGKGEVLGIIGESGCGKSTLGRLLVQLEKPYGGTVLLDNEDVGIALKRDALAFRRKAQIIFQNPFETFDPRHTIEQILCSPLRLHGIGENDAERIAICKEGLHRLGLAPAEDYLSRWPHELSGGQLQRISVLRSMQLKPKLIVADEPVSMLDVSVRADLLNLIMGLIKENNTSMVFISHDIAVTRYVSNRIFVMYLGRIVESGISDEVVRNPSHPYTKVLISNFPSVEIGDQREGIEVKGEPPSPINPGPGCYFAPRCYMAQEKCFHEYPKAVEVSPGHYSSCLYNTSCDGR